MRNSSKRSIVTYPLKDEAAALNKAAALAAADNMPAVEADIAGLLDKTLEILRREITHLMMESAGEKLSSASSTSLVNYVKLLKDLHEDEQTIVDEMSDEDLQAIMEKRHVKAKHQGSGKGTEEEE